MQAAEHPPAQLGLAELGLDRDDADAARDLLEGMLRRIPPGSAMSRAGPLELLIRGEIALGENSSAPARLEEPRDRRRSAEPAGWQDAGGGAVLAAAGTYMPASGGLPEATRSVVADLGECPRRLGQARAPRRGE